HFVYIADICHKKTSFPLTFFVFSLFTPRYFSALSAFSAVRISPREVAEGTRREVFDFVLRLKPLTNWNPRINGGPFKGGIEGPSVRSF
ncbi:MAG TPA: hypothetical protein PK777_09225, partial [Thermoguttaceae bacterium]|nr:hypothetical protein [Thermoguttaceae bacterium]